MTGTHRLLMPRNAPGSNTLLIVSPLGATYSLPHFKNLPILAYRKFGDRGKRLVANLVRHLDTELVLTGR